MLLRRVKGFSILELLIVLAVVGILAAVAVYALGVSRANSRDAKRISDVSVLRSGLSQHWLLMARYPVNEGVDLGVPGGPAIGLTTDGFVGVDGTGNVILPKVPIGPKAGEYYRYK
ncbi:type II secretion system GspH family protein, partial [Candidatus Uhrbacteria bacterium]|nr:type II secretion system GspH family protein [Candidatus Uhrbacteria bacterium]